MFQIWKYVHFEIYIECRVFQKLYFYFEISSGFITVKRLPNKFCFNLNMEEAKLNFIKWYFCSVHIVCVVSIMKYIEIPRRDE